MTTLVPGIEVYPEAENLQSLNLIYLIKVGTEEAALLQHNNSEIEFTAMTS
jgi:hypothetical protein